MTISNFFGPAKHWATTLQKATFVGKISKLVVTLCIHSSRQVAYMLEKFEIIWSCTTYRKKIVSRKKYRMIQNTKLLRVYLWN